MSIAESRTLEPAQPPPRAPSAAELVDRLATEPGVRDRVLADAGRSVAYRQLPELLAAVEERFAAVGASPGESRWPVAFECSQSVAGALGLLYLLSRGYDVVLLPDLSGGAKESGTPRFVPDFCSHVVSAPAGGEPTVVRRRPRDGAFRESAAVAELPRPDGGADLYLRTSGSTGAPKLSRTSHRRWLGNARACVGRWRLSADDRLSVPVPIFHSYGFGAAFLPGLLAGASIDVGSGGNLLRYLEREERFDPNVGFLTPSLADAFLAVRKAPRPYRFAVTAGDKVKPETVEGFEPRFGPLLDLYGSAEMGAVSSPSPDDPLALRLGTAGRPLVGIELRVSEAGALQVRQANGLSGYLVREESGWRFEGRADLGMGGRWFETGDLAEIRDDGFVRILGRARLSVKRDGLLVVFADVEAALGAIEGVARAVVVAGGESARGTRLVAVCRLEEGASLSPEEVRARAFERLPRYAVPDEVRIVEALPHLPSGKVDRRAVAEQAATSGPPPGGGRTGRHGTG
jgi:acyl-coenzyme A synthetase/AMP-(fatty) acid ligase